jgi:hypothetical protein
LPDDRVLTDGLREELFFSDRYVFLNSADGVTNVQQADHISIQRRLAMQDRRAQVRAEPGFRHDVNAPAEKHLQVLLGGDEIEQVAAWFQVDEKVEVAL